MALAAMPASGEWQLGRRLGSGTFGAVYSVTDSQGRQLPYAVKRVSVASKQDRELCMKEISTLARLQHPNIIRYLGFQADPHDATYCLIITELATGGSVEDRLKRDGVLAERQGSVEDRLKRDGVLAERQVWRYTGMILESLAYIHSQMVIHRDIKGANILLDGDVVKVADFGLAKFALMLGVDTTMNAYFITKSHKTGVGFHTSLGSTVVQMLTGDPPNMGLTGADIIERALAGKIPQYKLPAAITSKMKGFLALCFTQDPVARPGAKKLLADMF